MAADNATTECGDATVMPESLRNKAGWKLKLITLVVSIFFALLLGGIVLRLLGHGAPRGPYRQLFAGKGIVLMCFDRNIGGYFDVDLRDPNVRQKFYREYGVIDMEQTYRYTPYGVVTSCDKNFMRADQIRPRTPGKIRLVAIGDSFTYGHGLKDGDPWPSQLEVILNKADNNRGRFEVLNLAVGGRDLPQISEIFHQWTPVLEPDAVIYGWCLNDVIVSPQLDRIRSPSRSDQKQVRTVPGRYQGDGWDDAKGAGGWIAAYGLFRQKLGEVQQQRSIQYFINSPYGPDNASGWSESQRVLREMADACRTRKALLHVAIWPMLVELSDRYPFEPAHEALAEACRHADIPVVDLLDRMKSHPVEELILHPEDPHPNKLACRLAAEAIYDHLRIQYFTWFH